MIKAARALEDEEEEATLPPGIHVLAMFGDDGENGPALNAVLDQIGFFFKRWQPAKGLSF